MHHTKNDGVVLFFRTFYRKSRVCSRHFVDGKPTVSNPFPMQDMGYNTMKKPSSRKPPTTRLPLQPSMKPRLDDESNLQSQPEEDTTPTPETMTAYVNKDHSYSANAEACCNCLEMKREVASLQNKLANVDKDSKKTSSIVSRFISTYAKVNCNTGVRNLATLDKFAQFFVQISQENQALDRHQSCQ